MADRKKNYFLEGIEDLTDDEIAKAYANAQASDIAWLNDLKEQRDMAYNGPKDPGKGGVNNKGENRAKSGKVIRKKGSD